MDRHPLMHLISECRTVHGWVHMIVIDGDVASFRRIAIVAQTGLEGGKEEDFCELTQNMQRWQRQMKCNLSQLIM